MAAHRDDDRDPQANGERDRASLRVGDHRRDEQEGEQTVDGGPCAFSVNNGFDLHLVEMLRHEVEVGWLWLGRTRRNDDLPLLEVRRRTTLCGRAFHCNSRSHESAPAWRS
jgi:hypothetical protein